MHDADMDIDPGQIAYTPSFVEEFGCYLGAPLRAP
jgi:hypothetical protein